MRVISGNRRGKKLLTPKGLDTRPTLDSVKESLFNIIAFMTDAETVLDMFGGSGQLGIEAVSRGASRAVICETSNEAYDVILKNVKSCGFTDNVTLVKRDVFDFLRSYKNKPFDLVFIDPPYKKSLADKALKALTEKENLLSNKAVLAAETSFDEELSEKYGEFELQKCAKYGTIKLWIYKKKAEGETE